MRGTSRRPRRRPLDFVNPIDLIVDGITRQIRWAGARVITGVVLLAALGVMSVAFIVPILVAYGVIAVFGLTVEPYKWLGMTAFLTGFVVGVVAAVWAVRRLIRRAKPVLAYTMFADEDPADPTATGPSPTVPAKPSGPTREEWAAGIRSLDDRLRQPVETAERPTD